MIKGILQMTIKKTVVPAGDIAGTTDARFLEAPFWRVSFRCAKRMYGQPDDESE